MKSLDDFRRTYIRQRRRIAEQLGNPRLLQVTFGTLRHFKATLEYHRTKDILHVMRLLGHKSLKNTIVYTSLVSFEKDEYICKVARTVEEAKDLVEHGFEYVTDVDDTKLFRIRK
jgi:integrase